MSTLQGHILTPLPPLSPSCLVQISNCGLMAVFEADLAHKQAKEVFRAIITQSLPHSLSLSRPPSPFSSSLVQPIRPLLPRQLQTIRQISGSAITIKSPACLYLNWSECQNSQGLKETRCVHEMKFKLPASPNIKSVCLIACDQLGKKKDMREKERQGERASERVGIWWVDIKNTYGGNTCRHLYIRCLLSL